MKKLLALILTAVMALSLMTGCQKPEPKDPATEEKPSVEAETPAEDSYKVALLIAGNLGDKSFFDAANAGVLKAAEELSAEVKVIEMGTDKTKYEPTFQDICGQDWDMIITGGPDMTDIMNQYAGDYRDKTFMNYDASNDTVADNIYSVAYAANELSYLSGALAALVSTASDIPGTNEEAQIGFIGGMDIPGINDFLVGYIQGAVDVNPDAKVVISYAQDFGNPAKGKELALNQYQAGVDVIFSAAGGTGLGVLDAAKEQGLYAIGVDSDQALLFADTDPEKAEKILSSAIKRIDQVVFNGVEAAMEGKLALGTYEVLGFKQEGVGIADNDIYQEFVPETIRTQIADIEQSLVDGKVEVVTAIGMVPEDLDAMRTQVAP